MPVTKRVQSVIVGLYREFGLDLAVELDRLAEDAARKRHGKRVTLRDLSRALRLLRDELRQWPDEALEATR